MNSADYHKIVKKPLFFDHFSQWEFYKIIYLIFYEILNIRTIFYYYCVISRI